MDRALRNNLRLAVTQARRLLEEAIAGQLAGEFGIDRNGAIEDAARLVNLDAEGQRFRLTHHWTQRVMTPLTFELPLKLHARIARKAARPY